MCIEIADKVEMIGKARFGQHQPAVTANGKDASALYRVVIVEQEHLLLTLQAALVNHRLAIVLTLRFQSRQLEQAIGGRNEGNAFQLFGHFRIIDTQRAVCDKARIGKAGALGEHIEITPIKRAGQAFAMQHRIIEQMCRNAAIGINIGEVKLSARLEQTMGGAEHRLLVGHQIYDAIGYDHIKALWLQIERIKLLDIAFDKPHIAIAKAVCVPIQMLIGDGQLLFCGIYTGDRAVLAHQLREQIGILTCTRSQIEHLAALNRLRNNQPAAVISRLHLWMDIGKSIQNISGRGLQCATGIGAQIIAASQYFAIIILRVFQIHETARPFPAYCLTISRNIIAWHFFSVTRHSMDYSHDVIVIGGGAAGLTAAGGCALFGLKTALIEKGEMGGECLNNGCVPSKALISAGRRAAQAREEKRLGVQLAAPKVEWSGVHKHIHDAIATIAPHDSQERFEDMGCEVFRDYGFIVNPKTVDVGGRRLTAPRIVIATGSQPFVPPIEGIEDVPYLTNENLFELPELPKHLIVIGGGVIGMEMGQSFRRLGSDVTIINPGRLMGRDDPDCVAVIAETMRKEGVRFVDGKAVKVSGSEHDLRIETDGGEAIEGSHLLVAVGRKARVEGYGLEELGLEMAGNGIKVDARRRTSRKNIYAIGDCRDGPRLTHVSGYEGSNVALEIATGLPTKVDWRALPWCTYTHPEVAQIGMTEAEARAQYGEAISVVSEGFDHNDRAICEGGAAGHMKLVLKGKKVLGASIVGENAGELLLPLTQAITGKSSTFALGGAVIAYPTRSEITKALAFKAWEPTVFGAWPKKYVQLVAKLRRMF